jgi:hypothetical protein
VVEGGRDQLQPFHRRQHGNRRCDDGVAKKHGSADDAEQKDERGAPPERACRQRSERQRAALAVVVRPQQQDHVFEGDHDDQRPQDQREHAEHDGTGHRAGFSRGHHCDAERIERAGADIAIDDADAAQGHRPQARLVM